MLCDGCINQIKTRLKADDVVLLEILRKEKAISSIFGYTKKKIQDDTKLTTAKLNYSISRMIAVGLIAEGGGNGNKKTYYITESGLQLLKKF